MAIFDKTFDTATEEDIELLKEYFQGFDYRGAGYTFVANYIWRESHCVCWQIIGDYLCIAGSDCMIGDRTSVMAMPLTRNGSYEASSLRNTILEAKKIFENEGIKFRMSLIPGHMTKYVKDAFPEGINLIHEVDDDEYIYEKIKLIKLSGRPLHKKKNHLNHFLKNYEYEVRKITGSMKADIMAFVYNFITAKAETNDEGFLQGLELEAEAISNLMNIIDDVDTVHGVAIYMNEKLEAFAMGEEVSHNMASENFEKANTDYRGLYQTVCMEYCKSLPEKIKYINREEDMGLLNLREAKEALKPVSKEERYDLDFQ